MNSQCRTTNKGYRRATESRGGVDFVQAPTGRLDSLRQAWLEGELATASPELHLLLRRAGDEAAALAWASTFPTLTLPELLVEKGQEARRRFQRQQHINQRHQLKTSLAA